ncbi:MAG: hypothetical protein FJ395_19015 [Verrucomicrobia bacterium]|nr:hypothetical protein [Verrucomicrobiota bacterium]
MWIAQNRILGCRMDSEKLACLASPKKAAGKDWSPSDKIVVTPEQQEVLDAVEVCIAKKTELPEELWNKFWDMFGGEIEATYHV